MSTVYFFLLFALVNQFQHKFCAYGFQYVDSELFGKFITVPGYTVEENTPSQEITTRSTCKCRMACWSLVGCKSLTMVELDDSHVLCQLYEGGPLDWKVVRDANSTYIYWTETIPGVLHGFDRDDLFYFWVNIPSAFNAGRNLCPKIPGFRLAITRTITSYKIVKEITAMHGTSRFDLKKKKPIVMAWSSDDTVPSGAVKNYMKQNWKNDEKFKKDLTFIVRKSGKLDDVAFAETFPIICQANPLDISW